MLTNTGRASGERTLHNVVPPTVLVLFAFTGAVKGSSFLSSLPFDLTVTCTAILLLLLGLDLVGQKLNRLHFPLAAVLGLASMIPGIALMVNTDYASQKLAGLAVTLVGIAAGYYLISNGTRLKIWVLASAAFGGFLTAVALWQGLNVDGRLSIEGSNTIATGRLSGLALVIVVILALTKKRFRLPALIMAAALSQALISTGSRGPVLSAATTILVVSLAIPRDGRITRTVFTLATLAIGAYYISTQSGFGADRLQMSMSGEIDATDVRNHIWHSGFESIVSNPLGVGWGNYSSVLPGAAYTADRQYAHNVVLEATAEGGWLCGALVLMWIAFVINGLRKYALDPWLATVLGIVVFFTMNALVSGDINDNRPLWCALAVGAAALRTRKPPLTGLHDHSCDRDRSRIPRPTRGRA